MIHLDAETIRGLLSSKTQDSLDQLQTFIAIDSTNSHLMQASGPRPGKISIAATTNQTAGRGRQGKTWTSPAGSGVCLSAAYTFASQPENLPALTLAIGLAALTALKGLGAKGVQLKWPNDLVARDGKLGGILTEVHSNSDSGVTVVSGIGVNVDVGDRVGSEMRNDWAKSVVDLQDLCEDLPSHNAVAAALIAHLLKAFQDYEKQGFAPLVGGWSQHDWLVGRDLVVQVSKEEIRGIGAGIAEDGALLVETRSNGLRHIVSGTISQVGPKD